MQNIKPIGKFHFNNCNNQWAEKLQTQDSLWGFHRDLWKLYPCWCRGKTLKIQTYDGFVFLGLHGLIDQDPWSNTTTTKLEILKDVNGVDFGWPTMFFLNRNIVWPDTENYKDMSLPLSLIKASSKIGIKKASTISGNTLI